MLLEIRPLALPTPTFDPLLADSLADRQSMLQRLWKEWKNGGNRFALPGETLLGAWGEGRLVGVCGLNRDPYGGRSDVGRVRHLYVHREHRRAGVARSLVGRVIDAARPQFLLIELRTISPEANLFYRSLGFAPVIRAFATHELALKSPLPGNGERVG